MNKIAVISDLHLPYQSDVHLNQALALIKREKPDVIVVNGDLFDFAGLSKYQQIPNERDSIKDQLTLGWSFFSDLRKEHPKARIVYVCGNHDWRIRGYTIRIAPKLYDYVDLARDLELEKFRVEFVQTKESATKWTDTYFTIEDVTIGHFDTVNNPVIPAGMTVRNIMQKKIKVNHVVQSHVHRAAIIYDTNENNSIRWGAECPCLCKDPNYAGSVNWQRGLLFIDRIMSSWRPRLVVF